MYLSRRCLNMLTTIDNFLQQVMIPSLLGIVDKNMISKVHDLDGKILIATNLQARIWGYKSYTELVGKSLRELTSIINSEKTLVQLEQIRQTVIKEEKIVSYINFFPYNDTMAMLLSYHFPLFNLEGEVVATRVLSEQASLFKHSAVVTQMFKAKVEDYQKTPKVVDESIKLTKRQEEILYLLKIGFSQSDAANYLKITRGTLSKIISTQICPRFGIAGSNTKLLVKHVIKTEYFKHIPKSLLKPKVIIIENDFEFLID